MEEKMSSYEETKRAILLKKVRERRIRSDLDEFDMELSESSNGGEVLSDIAQVGTKVLIGGGLGLLAGVATIAALASVAEIVLAGAITKIAGVVGGAAGLSFGLKRVQDKKKRRAT